MTRCETTSPELYLVDGRQVRCFLHDGAHGQDADGDEAGSPP
jgi:hypothetical protein